MRWPWTKAERRQSDGAYAQAVLSAIEAEAAGTAADNLATAAVEAAAGAMSRAFAGAMVEGPDWAVETVTGEFLAQYGRDLIRRGESLHAIRMDGGAVGLIPCASWHWEGGYNPASWTVRATAYGPSTSTTWNLPASAVVFGRWGGDPGQPYTGRGPLRYAATSAKLATQNERSLADETAGPIAQLLAVPEASSATGSGETPTDPLAAMRGDITKSRGKALLVESMAAGHGGGREAAPRNDWKAERLGPNPPESMVRLAEATFNRTLAACGISPALFDDSDGTAQREALRRWHMTTVRPLARMLEAELSRKLAAPIKIKFDSYPLDLVSRAQVVDKLTRSGVAINVAMEAVGLSESTQE